MKKKLGWMLMVASLAVAGIAMGSEPVEAGCSNGECYNRGFSWEFGCIPNGNECLGCCIKKV